MVTGIHHITLVTRRVQANVDFYAGFLGLRLVKRTGGFEDAEQLHLFYGDRTGSPGSLVTFLVWEDGAPGRVGHGQVAEIAFAVTRAALGDWVGRALERGIPHEHPRKEFGEPVLRLKDPDGVVVKLVGSDLPATAPWTDTVPEPLAITRLRSATLFSEAPEQTAAFIARFGYRPAAEEGTVRRMVSDTDAIDIRDATGFWPGVPGTGVADHVAFRAPDVPAIRSMEAELSRLNATETNLHDRKYFVSLYAREPAGTLIEYATDGPGFLLDEPEETLGTTVMIPPSDAERANDLRVMLPQFALPGAPRFPRRDLPFVHRLHEPEQPDGSVLFLLHGTGGSEADLMPFARRVAPHALLIGLRGRSTEEGTLRWFRRLVEGRFDEEDIRSEAEALSATVATAIRGYGLDTARSGFLGYSNGANMIWATMLLEPRTVQLAVLLRPVAVLSAPPVPEGNGAALIVSGALDEVSPPSPLAAEALRAAGVDVTEEVVEAGHALTPADAAIVKAWLERHL